MLSLFRKKEHPDVPEWADFFTPKEYAAFCTAVADYFSKQQVSYQINEGVLQLVESWHGMDNLGLTNVAQTCKQEAVRNYSEIVEHHFEAMRRSQEYEAYFQQLLPDFEQIAPYIGVRIYHEDYLLHIGRDKVVGKDLGAGMFAMLVYDFPDSIKNVSPGDLTHWNQSEAALLERGIRNIRANYPLTTTRETIGESTILFAHDDHFFVSNLVFEFENRPELLGKHGALVGLPHRHATLVYPIETKEVLLAVNELIPLIAGMNNEGPGSISNQLLWYRNGTFLNLPYELSESTLQFMPPDAFVHLINELVEKQSS